MLGKSKEAIANYELSTKLVESQGERERQLLSNLRAFNLGVIGIIHRDMKEYEPALKFMMKSLEVNSSASNQMGQNINLGLVYKSLMQKVFEKDLWKLIDTSEYQKENIERDQLYQKANDYFQKALAIAKMNLLFMKARY